MERARAEGKVFGRPIAPLPDLAALQALLAAGVRDRGALAARLGCTAWAVRKAQAELAKNGSAKGAVIQTEPPA